MDCKVYTPQSCAAKAPSCHVRYRAWCREIFRLRFAALEMTGKQESLSPHGLRRRKALLDLPLCHIVMLSILLNQPLRGFPLPPLTRSPSPMDGGGKDVTGNAFCSCAMLSILLNQPPMAAFPPLVSYGTTFAPVGSVSHDSQVAITPLRIVFPCQPAKAVGQ